MIMSDMQPAARLIDVSKEYREDGLQVTAVSNVSIEIPRQRFATIIGPSGSGKTTLLNLLGCIDRPSSGRVEVCGENVGALNDRQLTAFRSRNISFIFQSFSLLPVLSAYENAEYPLLLLGIPKRERRERTMAMLENVGLAEHAHHRPNQLSGGQRQRVAIARALVKSPSLVLADEPTANLDSKTGAGIVRLMQRIQAEQGVTFIFSTHDPQLMAHAHETFVIRDGRLTQPQMKEAA